MRPPRFRFSNEVRETTRTIAMRMVDDGGIARTPRELDGWIAGAPDERESLERGGYGQEFTAEDLFPLLEVFIVQAGGPAREPDTPPEPPMTWSRVALILFIIVLMMATLAVAMMM
ncbi:hypothetical protein [Longimicrobium sp.]|uniref:hypothetical protein n=1 Tax=Longimicrobium sp. TaxID=2029185 RepID=UPI003B3A37EB